MKILNFSHLKSLVIFSLLIFSSCAKKETVIEPPPPESPKYIVPLAKDNNWTFIRTYYDTVGLVISLDTLNYKIISDTLIHNQQWFKNSYLSSFYRTDSVGLWHYDDYAKLLYKYPAKVGEEYLQDYRWRVSVISTDTLINTPMGVLSCYQYQLDYEGFKINDFLAPGFGFVKMESAGQWFAPYPRLTAPFLYMKLEMISASITK